MFGFIAFRLHLDIAKNMCDAESVADRDETPFPADCS